MTLTVSPANIPHETASATPTSSTPKGDSGQLPSNPYDAVVDVYRLPAENFPTSRVCFIFSASAARSFAQALDTTSCDAAINKITAQITDRNAYAEPDLSMLPTPTSTTVTVSSCDFTVTGGPRLGTFTVTKQDQGWEITGYQAEQPCG